MERDVVRVRAVVMTRDDSSGGWVPLGGGGVSHVVICKGQSSEARGHAKYFVRGERLRDRAPVLDCAVQRGLVYNKVNPIFHHWRVEERKFGLTFQSPADAVSFESGLRCVIDWMDRGTTSPVLCSPEDGDPDDESKPSRTDTESSFNSRKETLPKPITIVTGESSSTSFVHLPASEDLSYRMRHTVTAETPAMGEGRPGPYPEEHRTQGRDLLSKVIEPWSAEVHIMLQQHQPSSTNASRNPSLLMPATPSPLTSATPSPLTSATPSPLTLATPSPLTSATPSPLTSATPSPLTLATPSPLTSATPSPLTSATPSPLTLATPSPLMSATPSPLTLATPSLLTLATPSPLTSTTPSPLMLTTPSPLMLATPSPLMLTTPSPLTWTTPPLLTPTTPSPLTPTTPPLLSPTTPFPLTPTTPFPLTPTTPFPLTPTTPPLLTPTTPPLLTPTTPSPLTPTTPFPLTPTTPPLLTPTTPFPLTPTTPPLLTPTTPSPLTPTTPFPLTPTTPPLLTPTTPSPLTPTTLPVTSSPLSAPPLPLLDHGDLKDLWGMRGYEDYRRAEMRRTAAEGGLQDKSEMRAARFEKDLTRVGAGGAEVAVMPDSKLPPRLPAGSPTCISAPDTVTSPGGGAGSPPRAGLGSPLPRSIHASIAKPRSRGWKRGGGARGGACANRCGLSLGLSGLSSADGASWPVDDTGRPPAASSSPTSRCIYCRSVFSASDNGRGRCQEAPDPALRCLRRWTCVWCAESLLYHCASDPEGEFWEPCSCEELPGEWPPAACCVRWVLLLALSLLVPCMCCYLPLCACLRCGEQCGCCGGKHKAAR